jgi:hypothetical protein
MKKIVTLVTAGFIASVFSFAANAETTKVSAKLEKSCKAQAAKKFSAVHFLERRDFVKKCTGET